MTRVTIVYEDNKVEINECKAALLDQGSQTINILYHNKDLEIVNWSKCKSYTLHIDDTNDTNKGTAET